MNGNLLLSIVVTFKKSISNFVILPENKKSKVLCKKNVPLHYILTFWLSWFSTI